MSLADIEIFRAALGAHQRTFAATGELEQHFSRAVALCRAAIEGGGRLMFCGNGGSAADAQHAAAEMTGRFRRSRRALPALALTTDTSALTAIGNDFGFEQIFARQIEALGRPGDVLIAISTSGDSPNVLAAVAAARAAGMRVLGLSGASGGGLAELCDVALRVPASETERVQEVHIFLLHCLCAAIEADQP